MDFLHRLREANNARQELWDPERKAPITFRTTELAGELGEALNEIKKIEREKLGFKGSRATMDKVASEIADILICLDLVASDLGIDLESATIKKFNETSDKVGFDIWL